MNKKRAFVIIIIIILLIALLFGKGVVNYINKRGLVLPQNPGIKINQIGYAPFADAPRKSRKSWVGDLMCGCSDRPFGAPSKNVTKFIERVTSPLYRPPIVTPTFAGVTPKRTSIPVGGVIR